MSDSEDKDWRQLALELAQNKRELTEQLEQAQARIREYERCLNLMTGIPASVGISEPVEGYAEQPEMAVTVMTLMSDLIAHSSKPVKEIEARAVEKVMHGNVLELSEIIGDDSDYVFSDEFVPVEKLREWIDSQKTGGIS